MTRSDKDQPEQSASQRKQGHSKRNKKHQSRSITHYFARLEHPPLPTSNSIPPPVSQPSRKDSLLAQKKEGAMMRSTSQKAQHQAMLSAIRTAIIKQLKKTAQIDRALSQQLQTLITDKSNRIHSLNQFLTDKRRMMEGQQLSSMQLTFIRKEVRRAEEDVEKQREELRELEEEGRVRREEEQSYLARENWPLLHKRYQPLRLIGKGGFSQVYLAHDLQTHVPVAVKLSDVEHLLAGRGNKADYLRHIRREYEVHKRLSHPNIVQLIEVAQIDNAICIVLEHCEGPTLAELLHREKLLPEPQARTIVYQLLSVVCYLSSQRVVHYDLKPQNIMFDRGTPKVLDFGICKTFDSQHSKMALTSQGMGSFCYLPPQTFTSNPLLSPKVDVWSLGVIFYELVCGYRPPVSEELTFPQSIQLSSGAKNFIGRCLQRRVQKRASPEQAKNHFYFSSNSDSDK